MDEAKREIGLKKLRKENFTRILTALSNLKNKPKPRLLEVGSAHGWFLESAMKEYDVLGIEPDKFIFENSKLLNVPVRLGFFPSALQSEECFDVIVFNDVIEHIPEIEEALNACVMRLNQGGVLALNLPNSRGVFYLLSKLLAYFGSAAPFERMWQYGFPSPHVHYFSQKALEKLVTSFGFETVYRSSLPSIISQGLLERISYGSSDGRIKSLLLYVMTLAAIPFLRFLPADIHFFVFRKI